MPRKTGRKVILDSNFLFVPVHFKIDIFEAIEELVGRFEPIVLSTTLDELRRIFEEGSEKVRREANLVRLLASRCRLMEVQKGVGETCVRVAKELGCAVATNDRELRRRLRREGITTIFLRGKSRIEIEGEA
ncbi:MAG: DNA-binding protein [Candidatus Bathyarchaeota archaeon B26-1]|nr:MAG: DNA-binding protein [Candidatus Bathyarchaeota archaeon B26-1]